MSSIHPCSGKETSWTLSTMIRPKLSLLQPLHPTMNRLIIYTITHSSSNRTLHFTTHSSSNRTLHISFSVSNSSCARPSRNVFVLSRPSSSRRGVTRFTREWTWITLRFSPAVSVPKTQWFMIQVQIRISVQIPFRNTTDVHTSSWRTYREHLFLEWRNTWSPFIYLFYISRNTETRHISAPLPILNVAICTSVDVCESWRHFSRAICTSIDPLELHPNLCAICTSIDALELDPSAYVDLKESTRCKESTSTKETPSKRRNQ